MEGCIKQYSVTAVVSYNLLELPDFHAFISPKVHNYCFSFNELNLINFFQGLLQLQHSNFYKKTWIQST